jgi:hypothetical protein
MVVTQRLFAAMTSAVMMMSTEWGAGYFAATCIYGLTTRALRERTIDGTGTAKCMCRSAENDCKGSR